MPASRDILPVMTSVSCLRPTLVIISRLASLFRRRSGSWVRSRLRNSAARMASSGCRARTSAGSSPAFTSAAAAPRGARWGRLAGAPRTATSTARCTKTKLDLHVLRKRRVQSSEDMLLRPSTTTVFALTVVVRRRSWQPFHSEPKCRSRLLWLQARPTHIARRRLHCCLSLQAKGTVPIDITVHQKDKRFFRSNPK